MANPNIVNVTAIYGNTTYAALTTTLTTVLLSNAASSGKVYKINSIMVSNIDGTSAADVTVKLNTSASGGGTSYSLASTISVPADATLNLIDGKICKRDNMFLGVSWPLAMDLLEKRLKE